MSESLHVKYPLFLSDFNFLKFSEEIFKKYSNIKFYESRSSRSQIVSCGQMDGWTDMTKLTADFYNCVKAP
jgi:hypothetical protein